MRLRPYSRDQARLGEADLWGAGVAEHDLVDALLESRIVPEIVAVLPLDVYTGAGDASELPPGPSGHRSLGMAAARERLAGQEVIFLDSIDLAVRAARLRGLLAMNGPCVGVLHTVPGPSSSLYYAMPWLFQPGDVLVSSSSAGTAALHAVRDEFNRAGSPFPAVRQIPLGVNAEAYSSLDRAAARRQLGLPDDASVVLSVGRLSRDFKADLVPLLRAFTAVRQTHPNAVLLLAGADRQRYSAELATWAQRFGIAEALRIETNFDTSLKPVLYAAADVFVSVPDNVQETFGLVLLEAMAAGLPVVASDWSGYRDLVVHERTGLLVPTSMSRAALDLGDLVWSAAMVGGDACRIIAQSSAVDADLLASNVQLLLSDPVLARRFGAEGRARVHAHFSWRVVARAYGDLFAECLVESRATRSRSQARAVPLPTASAMFSSYATSILTPQSMPAKLGAAASGEWEPFNEAGVDRVLTERAAKIVAALRDGRPLDPRRLAPHEGQTHERALAWLRKRGILA